MKIDGIYHSKEYEDCWIIKKDEKYYSAPIKCILVSDLEEIDNINTKLIRPVGKNVERLLLSNSNIEVKDNELRAIDINRKEKIEIEPTPIIDNNSIEL